MSIEKWICKTIEKRELTEVPEVEMETEQRKCDTAICAEVESHEIKKQK